jgi:hypothetical protein
MSPIISGGGGGGPAAGTYLPVADAAGVTVDTTTYADPVEGADKLATLVFPVDTGLLAVAQAGDAHPRVILASDPTDGWYFGDGTVDPYLSGVNLAWALSPARMSIFATLTINRATQGNHAPQLSQLSPVGTIGGGALPTQQLVSTTGAQILTTRDTETVTPVTFNPTAGAAATCVVALSPDNSTYSNVGTETEPAGIALDGTIHLVKVRVPAGWYLKMTTTNATLGLTTLY